MNNCLHLEDKKKIGKSY